MKTNQLTRGKNRRVMYVENKDGEIDGAAARIRGFVRVWVNPPMEYRWFRSIRQDGAHSTRLFEEDVCLVTT